MKKLIKTIAYFWHKRQFNKAAYSESGEERDAAKKYNLPDLTSQEKDAVSKRWKYLSDNLSFGYPGFAIYKHFYGFDPNYMPFGYFFPRLLRKLNPIEYSHVFCNKSLMYRIFHEINQPVLVLNRLQSCYFDKNGNVIDEQAAINVISSYGKDLLIKKSSGSCCGKSINIIEPKTDKDIVSALIAQYDGDFIVQEKLSQSSYTSLFNETSLNTMRISTLLLDGNFSVCTSMIRFGTPNSIVDNLGAGGCCVGINNDGSLKEFGFTSTFDKISEWNGVKFKGHCIPSYDKIVDFARKAHYCIPNCCFVGWDIALDGNDNCVLIELNTNWPGIFYEQLADGKPAFFGREDELLDFFQKTAEPYCDPV